MLVEVVLSLMQINIYIYVYTKYKYVYINYIYMYILLFGMYMFTCIKQRTISLITLYECGGWLEERDGVFRNMVLLKNVMGV